MIDSLCNQLPTIALFYLMQYYSFLKALPWPSILFGAIAFILVQSGRHPEIFFGYCICLIIAAIWLTKLSVILHEIGHIVFCWLGGGQPLYMVLGRGRELFRVKVAGVWCIVHKNIVEGRVMAGYRTADRIRARHSLFLIGGIVVNVLLVLGGIAYTGSPVPSVFLVEAERVQQINIAGILVYANYSLLFFVLQPFSLRSKRKEGDVYLKTDGRQLLALPFMKEKEIRQLLIIPTLVKVGELSVEKRYEEALEVVRSMLEIYPDDWLLKATIVSIHTKLMNLDAAFAVLSKMEHPDEGSAESAYIHNQQAWLYLLSGNTDVLELAGYHSRKADEISSDSNIVDTRGAILIEKGEIDEGMALLAGLVDFSNPTNENLSSAMYMGYGWFLQGNPEEARRYMSLVEANTEKLELDVKFLYSRIKARMHNPGL